MKVLFLILVLLGSATSAWSEGIWEVDGYQLSNVHAWQQDNKIIVSGRVIGGPPCNLLTIHVLATSDQGDSVPLTAYVGKYSGNGELFEARKVVYHKSGYWGVASIEVQPQGLRNSGPRMQSPPPAFYKQQPDLPTGGYGPSSYSSFQNPRTGRIDNPSLVLFSSRQSVNIVVNDRNSNKVVLVKNIEPNRVDEIQMKRGRYRAKVIGQGISREIEFVIQGDKEVIRLD